MDKDKIRKAVRLLLEGIGEDPDRPGLRDTPERVAAMCEEIYSGIKADPMAVFSRIFHEPHDEIVLVRDIPFYSTCEHHLLPFLGKAHVAYLPDGGRLCGLSKLARVVEVHAKKPQMQERLATDVTVTFAEQDAGGWKITGSHIKVRGRVPGMARDAFIKAAEGASLGCPVSGALKGNLEITLDADLA